MRSEVSPFHGMDIRTLVDAQAASRADHPFLIWSPFEGPEQRWSFAEFAATVRRFAAGLQSRGVKPGDRILVHLDNCPEAIIAWIGCGYAGAIAVTTNARSSEEELSYFADHSGAVGAITQPMFADLVSRAAPELSWLAITATDNGAQPAAHHAFEPFEAIDGDPERFPARPHDPLAPFSIQYTSGTTARPKAVLWTHGNALWGARMCAQNEDLRPEDVHLTYLPMFHTNAQSYSVLASLGAGATVVLLPRFSASRFWPLSLKYKATWTSMVPFCVKALLGLPKPEAHFYRLWGNGVCEPPTDAHFGVKTIGWWGMTETVAQGIVGSVHLPNSPMSMGRPSPAYGIHVLDDGGRPVAPGETGDLFVAGIRGLSLFQEYFADPAATAASFNADGLLITGDRVTLGEDGFLYFADRSKDMLKVGGENVAASEIERVIAAVPGVAEVAVVARRHDMLDEVPVAFVIPAVGAAANLAELIAEACERNLSSFKRPHHVQLVESLPRSTLEKVAKAELRRVAEELPATEGLARTVRP